jgi:hypothetical protein
MTGEIEALADTATGAVLGRVAESPAGEAGALNTPRLICLNCSASLSGDYCAQCGQAASIHRSFSAMWHDFLHNVLHFDGKLWRTLPELALRPGHLTRRYIHGERAKFISPLSLFLLSIFFMFAASSLTGNKGTFVTVGPTKTEGSGVRPALSQSINPV